MATRSEKYEIAKAAGFTAKQARVRRSWGEKRFNRSIASKRVYEEKKRIAEKENIPHHGYIFGESLQRLSRYEEFGRWAGARRYPEWAMEKIIEYNRRAGLGDFDKFGYRAFFFEYVDREDEDGAYELAGYDETESQNRRVRATY